MFGSHAERRRGGGEASSRHRRAGGACGAAASRKPDRAPCLAAYGAPVSHRSCGRMVLWCAGTSRRQARRGSLKRDNEPAPVDCCLAGRPRYPAHRAGWKAGHGQATFDERLAAWPARRGPADTTSVAAHVRARTSARDLVMALPCRTTTRRSREPPRSALPQASLARGQGALSWRPAIELFAPHACAGKADVRCETPYTYSGLDRGEASTMLVQPMRRRSHPGRRAAIGARLLQIRLTCD